MVMITALQPSIMKAVVSAALACLGPIVSSCTDANNVPYDGSNPVLPKLGLRAIYSPLPTTYPTITVGFLPGRTPQWPGQNLVDFDPTTGLYLYGTYAEGSTISVLVQARSEEERAWLVDWLYRGMLFQPFPDSSGALVANAFQDALGGYGIVLNAIDRPDYPHVDFNAPRPASQLYEATLPLICDVTLLQQVAGTVTTDQIGVIASPRLGGINGFPLNDDPEIIVDANHLAVLPPG